MIARNGARFGSTASHAIEGFDDRESRHRRAYAFEQGDGLPRCECAREHEVRMVGQRLLGRTIVGRDLFRLRGHIGLASVLRQPADRGDGVAIGEPHGQFVGAHVDRDDAFRLGDRFGR
jgi:hypothetical protein